MRLLEIVFSACRHEAHCIHLLLASNGAFILRPVCLLETASYFFPPADLLQRKYAQSNIISRSRQRSNGFGKTTAKVRFFNAKSQSRQDFIKTPRFFALLGQKLHFLRQNFIFLCVLASSLAACGLSRTTTVPDTPWHCAA
jgi:hypothetical protein